MVEKIPISKLENLYIGMLYTDVINLIRNENIRGTQDMKNGYKWLHIWINPFDSRILSSLCFYEDQLEMILIYPQINDFSKPGSWDDANEKNMNKEYKVCKKWFSKYKKHLPHSAEVFKDIRNWDAGICIR